MAVATIDYEPDWETRLLGRLYWQFRSKPRIVAWTRMIARQVQDVEDVFQAILSIVSIDDSVGAQLDNLGRFLGQPRAGLDDDTYRLYLKARIIANKSDGTPEAIYKVFRALFGPTVSMVIKTSDVGVKTFVQHVATVLTAAQVQAGLTFLRQSKEAGARAILEWQPSAAAATFTLDNGPGCDVGVFAGANQA